MDKTTGSGDRGSSDNVVFLRPTNPLFTRPLREKLEAGVKSQVVDPKKLVDNLEVALCAWLVSSVRQFVTRVVNGTSKMVLDKVGGG